MGARPGIWARRALWSVAVGGIALGVALGGPGAHSVGVVGPARAWAQELLAAGSQETAGTWEHLGLDTPKGVAELAVGLDRLNLYAATPGGVWRLATQP